MSEQKDLLRSWPKSGPQVLWSTVVGRGFGGPAAWGGKVYLLDREGEARDVLRCLDLVSGKELWRFAYEAPGSVMFPGSRGVPTLDGNYVYTCGHNGDLYCIDIDTQKPVWNTNIWTDFGGVPPAGETDTRRARGRAPGSFPFWAISQHPLIYGDLLIIASQAPEAGVVAYDKKTGKLKWKTPPLGFVSYVSPAVVSVDGNDHIVMITPSFNRFQQTGEPHLGNVIGIAPLTGKLLWKYDQWNCHITVASAVDAGDNRVLVVGGYELGATMLRIAKQADGSYAATELFTTEEFGDQTKPPIQHNGYFYAQYGTNNRRDGLVCMSLDGEIMWKTKRNPNFDKGSMILADGLILATDGSKSLYLIEPNPSEFTPLASVHLLVEEEGSDSRMRARFGNQNWAPMALADGKLLLRDQRQLLCVQVAETQ